MDLISLVTDPIDAARLLAHCQAPDCGAVALFLGTVRDHHEGKQVTWLEYEAYPRMAENRMREIGEDMRRRWQLGPIAMTHRVGRLAIGEVSVAVAVASPHRAEAFEACRYAIDTLKESVPIWKRESGEGGQVWIEGPALIPTTEPPPAG